MMVVGHKQMGKTPSVTTVGILQQSRAWPGPGTLVLFILIDFRF